MPSASTFDIAKALLLSCIHETIAYIFSNRTARITTPSINLRLLVCYLLEIVNVFIKFNLILMVKKYYLMAYYIVLII